MATRREIFEVQRQPLVPQQQQQQNASVFESQAKQPSRTWAAVIFIVVGLLLVAGWIVVLVLVGPNERPTTPQSALPAGVISGTDESVTTQPPLQVTQDPTPRRPRPPTVPTQQVVQQHQPAPNAPKPPPPVINQGKDDNKKESTKTSVCPNNGVQAPLSGSCSSAPRASLGVDGCATRFNSTLACTRNYGWNVTLSAQNAASPLGNGTGAVTVSTTTPAFTLTARRKADGQTTADLVTNLTLSLTNGGSCGATIASILVLLEQTGGSTAAAPYPVSFLSGGANAALWASAGTENPLTAGKCNSPGLAQLCDGGSTACNVTAPYVPNTLFTDTSLSTPLSLPLIGTIPGSIGCSRAINISMAAVFRLNASTLLALQGAINAGGSFRLSVIVTFDACCDRGSSCGIDIACNGTINVIRSVATRSSCLVLPRPFTCTGSRCACLNDEGLGHTIFGSDNVAAECRIDSVPIPSLPAGLLNGVCVNTSAVVSAQDTCNTTACACQYINNAPGGNKANATLTTSVTPQSSCFDPVTGANLIVHTPPAIGVHKFTCVLPDPQPCLVSTWSAWSYVSNTACGDAGTCQRPAVRSRTVTRPPCHTNVQCPALVETGTLPCTTYNGQCPYQDPIYTLVTDCNAALGVCSQVFSTNKSTNGIGSVCNNGVNVTCPDIIGTASNPCDIDCVLSEWSTWNADAPCPQADRCFTDGSCFENQTRTRTVVTPACNQGVPCTAPLVDTRAAPCSTECTPLELITNSTFGCQPNCTITFTTIYKSQPPFHCDDGTCKSCPFIRNSTTVPCTECCQPTNCSAYLAVNPDFTCPVGDTTFNISDGCAGPEITCDCPICMPTDPAISSCSSTNATLGTCSPAPNGMYNVPFSFSTALVNPFSTTTVLNGILVIFGDNAANPAPVIPLPGPATTLGSLNNATLGSCWTPGTVPFGECCIPLSIWSYATANPLYNGTTGQVLNLATFSLGPQSTCEGTINISGTFVIDLNASNSISSSVNVIQLILSYSVPCDTQQHCTTPAYDANCNGQADDCIAYTTVTLPIGLPTAESCAACVPSIATCDDYFTNQGQGIECTVPGGVAVDNGCNVTLFCVRNCTDPQKICAPNGNASTTGTCITLASVDITQVRDAPTCESITRWNVAYGPNNQTFAATVPYNDTEGIFSMTFNATVINATYTRLPDSDVDLLLEFAVTVLSSTASCTGTVDSLLVALTDGAPVSPLTYALVGMENPTTAGVCNTPTLVDLAANYDSSISNPIVFSTTCPQTFVFTPNALFSSTDPNVPFDLSTLVIPAAPTPVTFSFVARIRFSASEWISMAPSVANYVILMTYTLPCAASASCSGGIDINCDSTTFERVQTIAFTIPIPPGGLPECTPRCDSLVAPIPLYAIGFVDNLPTDCNGPQVLTGSNCPWETNADGLATVIQPSGPYYGTGFPCVPVSVTTTTTIGVILHTFCPVRDCTCPGAGALDFPIRLTTPVDVNSLACFDPLNGNASLVTPSNGGLFGFVATITCAAPICP